MRGLDCCLAAERQLLDAAHRGEVNASVAAITAHFAALLASAEAGIIAHAQGRIAQIDVALSPAQRRAAIEQLQGEQVTAIARLKDDIRQERRQARRTATAALAAGHRTRKRALSHRQSAQRVALSVMIGKPLARMPAALQKREPIRRLAMRLMAKRLVSGAQPGTR